MPTLPTSNKVDPVHYLVCRRFPGLSWKERYGPPPSLTGVRVRKDWSGDADPYREAIEAANAYDAELRALPADEISKLFEKEQLAEAEERRRAFAAEEARRFYNHPNATANWAYWAAQSYWKIDEAVALSFGKDPHEVSWERLKSCTQIWPFAKQYERRLDQFKRAVWASQLWEATYPTIVLAWAARMGIVMPTELVSAVEALGLQIADWKTLHDEKHKQLTQAIGMLSKATDGLDEANRQLAALQASSAQGTQAQQREQTLSEALEQAQQDVLRLKQELRREQLNPKSRTSYQKMILAMAKSKYRFDPQAPRNSAVANILSDVHELPARMDEGVIRDRLTEAADRLAAGDFD